MRSAERSVTWLQPRLITQCRPFPGECGPDPLRGIYPVVATVDAEGYRRLEDDEVAERFQAVLVGRRERSGGGESS